MLLTYILTEMHIPRHLSLLKIKRKIAWTGLFHAGIGQNSGVLFNQHHFPNRLKVVAFELVEINTA